MGMGTETGMGGTGGSGDGDDDGATTVWDGRKDEGGERAQGTGRGRLRIRTPLVLEMPLV